MAHVNDYVCDVCGTWCSNAEVDGKPVPLVVVVNMGVPPDYPGVLELNASGVRVPPLVRELMAQPIARREYCVPCFARTFGLPLVAAPAPPPRREPTPEQLAAPAPAIDLTPPANGARPEPDPAPERRRRTRRGAVSVDVLVALVASVLAASGSVAAQAATATGSSGWAIIGGAIAVVGIYGFLLLAYRDLLRGQAKLEDEPGARKTEIGQLREEVARQLADAYERLQGLEDRERDRLERKAESARVGRRSVDQTPP